MSATCAADIRAPNLPSVSKYRQSTASATPAERSLPVEQANRMVGQGMRARRAVMKGGTRARWVRRARLPSLPTPQVRSREVGVSVAWADGEGGVELQVIVASKVSGLLVLVELMKILCVGRIITGRSSASPLSGGSFDASSRRLCIEGGKSSSLVLSSSFSCRQKRLGVSPCAQLSLSSAAPCTYFPSEASGRSTKRDAVRQIMV